MRVLRVQLVALLSFALGPTWCSSASPATEPRFPATFLPFDVGPYPRSAVVGDLNEDGRLDMVVANEFSNTATIRLGSPGEHLAPASTVSIGDFSQALELADLNGDGHLDLAVARSLDFVTVLLGDGLGTFQPAVSYAAGVYPAGMAVGDVDGDGDVDIVTANLGGSTVSIFLNQGDGTLAPRTDLPTPASPIGVAIGDLNDDGLGDLVVGFYSTADVSVYLAQGGDAFALGGVFPTAGRTSAVALAHLNEDDRLDLAVANDQSGSLSILLGNGSGGFVPRTDLATSARPLEVVCADLNADGALDVASSDEGAHSVSVFLGNGNGTFAPRMEFEASMAPNSITAGDLTGDGLVDLLTTSPYPGVASLLVGMGDGTFGVRAQYPTDLDPRSISLEDLNHDGILDVVTGNTASATVSVLLGQGDGGFGPKTESPVGMSADALAVGHVNQDAHPDAVIANRGSSAIVVLLGDGNGGFGPGTPFPAGGQPVDVELGDMNQDGNADVVTANAGVVEGSVSVLLGNGQGGFGPATPFAAANDPNSLVLEYLNEDEYLDVAIAAWWTPVLKASAGPTDEPIAGSFMGVLLGAGDGSLGPITVHEVGHGTRSITSGDLNGDGRPDLIAAGTQTWCCYTPPPEVSAIYSNGDGTFGPEVRYATGNMPTWVEVGDWNDDGILDLVVLRFGLNAVTLVPGLGEGAFGTPENYGVGLGPIAMALADLDGNHTTDIAIANSASSTVSILLNQGDPPALEVPVDIRPLVCPNSVNLRSHGLLQVAVLGTPEFDVQDLDPASVLLEGVRPFADRGWLGDIGAPSIDPETGCNCSTRSRDARKDRVFSFRIQDVVGALGFRTAGGERVLTLTGALRDGTAVAGTDCASIDDPRHLLRPTDELLVEEFSESPATPARLWELYPNPLPRSQAATFAYRVPDPGAEVSISIHTVAGRRLAELAQGFRAGGVHTVTWDGRDAGGAQFAPGVYFVKSVVGSEARRSTVVLLR